MFQKIKFILCFLFMCAMLKSTAQSSSSLKNSLDSINLKNDKLTILKNAEFIKNLVSTLKKKYSFNENLKLDTTHHVSVLKSADNKVKIFSWYLLMSDQSYRFYGCIQMATANGELKLFPLFDSLDTDENNITTNKNWFGAKYYSIIPFKNNYILMGWKGNNEKTSKKVIDVLWFENEEAMFGKNIFVEGNKTSTKNRIIFEYNKENAMTLQYDKSLNTIVFDHLAPINPSKKGEYEFYVSDGSFDGYKLTDNKLKFVENLILHNPIVKGSEDFENPKLKKPILKKKTN